jgi:hypothetical protein
MTTCVADNTDRDGPTPAGARLSVVVRVVRGWLPWLYVVFVVSW